MTRHLRFTQLLEHLHGQLGTLGRAASWLDMDPSYASQLKGGKNLGDRTARKIEAAAGLPHGWLDQTLADENEKVEVPVDALTSTVREAVGVYTDLEPRERILIANYRALDIRAKDMIDAAAAQGARARRGE